MEFPDPRGGYPFPAAGGHRPPSGAGYHPPSLTPFYEMPGYQTYFGGGEGVGGGARGGVPTYGAARPGFGRPATPPYGTGPGFRLPTPPPHLAGGGGFRVPTPPRYPPSLPRAPTPAYPASGVRPRAASGLGMRPPSLPPLGVRAPSPFRPPPRPISAGAAMWRAGKGPDITIPGMDEYKLKPAPGRLATSSHISYPCSGAGQPRQTSPTPFVQFYRSFIRNPSDFTSIIVQLMNCFETLAKRFPLDDPEVRHYPEWHAAMRKLVSIIVHLSSQCLKCLRELLTISDDVWRMAGGLISAKSPTGMLCDVMKRTVEGSDHHVLKRDEALRIVSQIRSTAEVLQHHSSNWVAALDTVQSELRPALLKYSGSLASCSEAISARKVATSPRLAGPSIPQVDPRLVLGTIDEITKGSCITSTSTNLVHAIHQLRKTSDTVEWWNDREAISVYFHWRDVHASLIRNITLITPAATLMLTALRDGGYLHSNGVGPGPIPRLPRPRFPSLPGQLAADEARIASEMAATERNRRIAAAWSPAAFSQGRRDRR